MMNGLKVNKNMFLFVASAIVVGIMLFYVWSLFNEKTYTHSDIAYVPNIEILTDASAIVVKGTVLDEGEPANLRRNAEDPNKEDSVITPGKYHSVQIEEVLNGDIGAKEILQVAVTGGSYKGVKAELEAELNVGQTYIFFLNKSSRGHPYFFGAGEPYIFEINGERVKAVSNLEFEKVFEDTSLTLKQLYEKVNASAVKAASDE